MLSDIKTIATLSLLVVLGVAECWLPFYAHFRSGFRERLAHDGRNLTLGVINAVVQRLALGGAWVAVVSWSQAGGVGLLYRVQWPVWLETILVLVVFDLWMYVWHRINHITPLLWRMHRMHHTDSQMDATSAVRFHPGEVLLSRAVQLLIVPCFGIELWQLVAYEAVMLPVILVHHCNVRFPLELENVLRWVIVPPNMHRVHHSRLPAETNSNYGSVLSVWDRLFGSYRQRAQPEDIPLGLDGYDRQALQTLRGQLSTPWRPLDDR